MNYHTQEIDVPIRTGDKTIKVTCHVAGDTGLAYCIAPGGDESIGYTIIHLASLTHLIQPIDTEYEVKLFMESIASITDWHQSAKEINSLGISAEIMNLQADITEQVNQKIETAIKHTMPDCVVEEVMSEISDEDYGSTLRKALIYALKIVD